MSHRVAFSDEHGSDTDGKTHQETPEPPEPSCVSMNSDRTKSEHVTVTDGGSSSERRNHKERPESPEGSCVSMKSDRSMPHPIAFQDGHNSTDIKSHEGRPDTSEPSCVSLKSDRSMRHPIAFQDGHNSTDTTIHEQRPDSPERTCVSMASDRSMRHPIAFQDGHNSTDTKCVSMKSDQSKSKPPAFTDGSPSSEKRHLQDKSDAARVQSAKKHQPELDSIFTLLEENIVTFVKNELKTIQRVLSLDSPEGVEVVNEDEEVGESKGEKKRRRSSRAALLKIIQHFLRDMKQEELANSLHSKTQTITCQRKLKSNLKKKFQFLFEGVAKAGNPALLNQIFTELYITEGGTGEVNAEHEIRQIETVSRKTATTETTIRREDIFKPLPGRDQPIRTMMTKGVAGIGKTVLTQKFTLDWAEGKNNQDIQFTFPFTFRELNVLKGKKYSLKKLLNQFFTETKDVTYSFNKPQVVFIFDGLDECRLSLDFHCNEILTDVKKSASLDVLLTNLIKGKLLPSARLWITTRPAAAIQIPSEFVDMVTEVRGFTDPQKEEYFMKRFKDVELASRIISHIETSRSLHIMCHIPVFCWITATVLEDVLKTVQRVQLPKTLTEMYIHFLVVQTKLKNKKYGGQTETDPHWSSETTDMILSLGKLAFEQLLKGNLIFYDCDLTECGIDITAASVYSGVLTQIFKEERGLYQDKVFSFVHLSVQEFLAAVHVHLTFINSGVNLLSEAHAKSKWLHLFKDSFANFHQSAVDVALRSPNGHLDLFLRFLLGLSLESNQALLQGLQVHERRNSQTSQTVRYIKKMIRNNLPPQRSINLFCCLNELNDCSLEEEIQQFLRSGSLSTEKLSPAHWSALVFLLLSSDKELDMFDLQKYSATEEGFLRLLPVVKASNKSLLDGCDLSERSCIYLAAIFSSQSSSLTEVDLSNNSLQNSGVMSLCNGLESPYCRVKTLRLNQTSLTKECCERISSVLSLEFCSLRKLYLNHNNLGDLGVKLLCAGLGNPLCKLEGLRLVDCKLSERSCEFLAPVLSSGSSSLRELDLSNNSLRCKGVLLISPGLSILETLRLSGCNLKESDCGYLASVLSSKSSRLTVLDLSNNDLQDSGVMKLSVQLGNPHCRLKSLSLSGCQVTEEGCASLASALRSNPFYLEELDLSYNHPGDLGVTLLSAMREDKLCRLNNLRMDNGGAQRLKPVWRKYACYLTLDPDTATSNLNLCGNNREVTGTRFSGQENYHWSQVFCRNGLTGHCYWEVKWRGCVSLGVTYRGINRKGENVTRRLGGSDKSWFLACCKNKFSIWHNNKGEDLHIHPSFISRRVGVYLNWPAGILSFYAVFHSGLLHLHSFHCTFTEPLYPAFKFQYTVEQPWSSALLLDL